MSFVTTREIRTPDHQPLYLPDGIRVGGTSTGAGLVNDIGTPGQQGFGVGIAPSLPTYFAELYGTRDPAAPTYGNYIYEPDGSIMCYEPVCYVKYGTGSNGLAVNVPDFKPFSYFPDLATANASGYFIPRAFYNAGSIRPGFFTDKYLCSKNGSVASSLKNGVVLTSATRGGLAASPFSSIGAADTFAGTIAAAKTRGANFFPTTQFQHQFLAVSSLAHGAAATSSTYCAYYDAAGVTNFPKGNNNNALGDANDASIAYVWDGNATYAGCGKTGSANFFSKTTHNGQECGVADVNGLVWRIQPFGITSDGTYFYLLNTGVDVTTITAGNTLATDCWGATGLAAMYTNVGATYGALTASSSNKTFGNAAQVLSEAVSGTAWGMAGAGIPLVGGVGGSNRFGNDYFYDARPNELCGVASAGWGGSLLAGPWARTFSYSRGLSSVDYGFSSACFL